ncbi:hypothetical protein [Altibacter sp. HG106]|uniref:hypothetical protein n=1 Tax=Altibacter sp. HG106 TaxID=3023937 RepID=UPI0023509531|nr:hypothetical protein [Altibacter sp. HG106]MDC7993637.1 hypothetical protein [Altibacter sp. HG106]
MKKILIVVAFAAFAGAYAQETKNENKTTVTTKTQTRVTDNSGVNVTTKETKKTATQELALRGFDGTHNFNAVMTPSNVNTDVDYSYGGDTYRFQTADTGYTIMTGENGETNYARIRPSSQKGYYIVTQDGNNSMGYFNSDGDFVVESYDPDNDGVMNYVYKIEYNDDMKMKKNKMKKDKMEK